MLFKELLNVLDEEQCVVVLDPDLDHDIVGIAKKGTNVFAKYLNREVYSIKPVENTYDRVSKNFTKKHPIILNVMVLS